MIVAFIFLCGNVFFANAQDDKTTKTEKKSSKFGSFLKKVGEVATGINMSNDPFVVNPLNNRFKVEFIDCIGNSAEQKFQLYLKITNNGTNESNMCVGEGCGDSSMAVDNAGNSYKPNRCAGDCNAYPTGVPVKTMVEFEKVLPSVKMMEIIKLNIGNYGSIELRNIPLKWNAVISETSNPVSDVLNEIKQMSFTNSLASKYDIQLVSCVGDSAKQRVEITLKLKNKGTNERVCVGDGCGDSSLAIDADGNSYKPEACAGDCVDLPTGINVKTVVGFKEILPNVKMFDYMKLNVNNGVIEIRNLSVNWK